ncbi:MAG: hypothetical protein Q7S03_01825 [bacterium]|nr:hypothetical protein [bacterium]
MIEKFRKEIRVGDCKSLENMADFLEEWLVDHVINTDRKYVRFFKSCGLK